MCLFIYYRNEPAIKATSNTLSLCLFVACYFLLASSLFHTVIKEIPIIGDQEIFRTFICIFDVIIANIGADIVCATVIAKTLRIYHIFKTFGKVGHACSDQILIIMILGIVSGKIAILIVWASVDDARVIDVEQFVSQRVPPFFQVTQECQSEHINIWHASLVSYSAILGLVMVLLAILTRKIKRKDYKDSKKINILIVALTLDVGFSLPLWIIFRSNADTLMSSLVFYTSITAAAVLCQVILILPKIFLLMVYKRRC